jgi:hypothetical protein
MGEFVFWIVLDSVLLVPCIYYFLAVSGTERAVPLALFFVLLSLIGVWSYKLWRVRRNPSG